MEEQTTAGNVKVLCRFRPLNSKQQSMSNLVNVSFLDETTVQILNLPETSTSKFSFDKVFDLEATQISVYQHAALPIVQAVMKGFNGTVFAYGQTSSGKTFTMSGPDIEDPQLKGITPRMIQTVFQNISMSNQKIQYSVKVSFAEIYLEKIRDLIDPARTDLKIHQDRTRGVFIKDLSEYYVGSDIEVYQYMKMGNQNREVAYTHMNAGSSRSHSLFIVTIAQNNLLDMSAKTGKFYLVDLAGSEKVGKTGAEGKRLEQAKNINKSLTTLGLVINSLTDGKSTHVPYRDSKLTRVLQDSLGGNSKTALIVTCSPSSYNQAQTLSTLRFGIRAKSIKNKPKVNKEYTVAELKLMLAKAREQIASLNRRLQSSSGSIQVLSSRQSQSTMDQIQSSEFQVIQQLEQTRKRLSEAVQENNMLKQELIDVNAQLEIKQQECIQLQNSTQDYQYRCDLAQTKVGQLKQQIQELAIANQSLEIDLVTLNQAKLNLQQKINQQDQENTHQLFQKGPISIATLQRVESEDEQEEEIKILNQQIKTLMEEKIPDIEKIREMVKTQINSQSKMIKQQQDKKIMEAVGSKIKFYVQQYENQLEKLREKYARWEQNLSEDDIELRKKNDTIEKNLQQLTTMYKQLTRQQAKLKAEKQIYQKKSARFQNFNEELKKRVIELEDEVIEASEKLDEYKQKVEELGDKKVLALPFGTVSSNLRKTIKGGNRQLNKVRKVKGKRSVFGGTFMSRLRDQH